MIILLLTLQSLFAYCLIVHYSIYDERHSFRLSNQKFQCKHGKTWESHATSYSAASPHEDYVQLHASEKAKCDRRNSVRL